MPLKASQRVLLEMAVDLRSAKFLAALSSRERPILKRLPKRCSLEEPIPLAAHANGNVFVVTVKTLQ
jgi:hypothetical protein